jgi:hypothetical protein
MHAVAVDHVPAAERVCAEAASDLDHGRSLRAELEGDLLT